MLAMKTDRHPKRAVSSPPDERADCGRGSHHGTEIAEGPRSPLSGHQVPQQRHRRRYRHCSAGGHRNPSKGQARQVRKRKTGNRAGSIDGHADDQTAFVTDSIPEFSASAHRGDSDDEIAGDEPLCQRAASDP